jgi:peptide/nickel transport system substrate-binding protein
MEEIRPGEFYRLVANDRYFEGPPKVPELIFPIIRDPAVSFAALQAGEVDANAQFLLPELVPTLARVPGLKVARGPGYVSTLLQFNVEHPVLKDVRLRQAMANAINTNLMVKLLMLGFAEPGSPGYLHPASPWHNPNAKLIPNKSRAVSLLNEAGYRARGGGGVREAPDGTPLRFTLLTRAGDPIRIRAAELIRTWLKDIGIAIEVRVLDNTAITDLVWPDFNACMGSQV